MLLTFAVIGTEAVGTAGPLAHLAAEFPPFGVANG